MTPDVFNCGDRFERVHHITNRNVPILHKFLIIHLSGQPLWLPFPQIFTIIIGIIRLDERWRWVDHEGRPCGGIYRNWGWG